VLQREGYSLFVFCGDFILVEKVIDDEGNGGRMCQHVCYGCPRRANKRETQAGCRPEHDISPSTTDLDKPVPPPFTVPFATLYELAIDLAFV
jgi:hypothetical protein